jgi:hypothetical protein
MKIILGGETYSTQEIQVALKKAFDVFISIKTLDEIRESISDPLTVSEAASSSSESSSDSESCSESSSGSESSSSSEYSSESASISSVESDAPENHPPAKRPRTETAQADTDEELVEFNSESNDVAGKEQPQLESSLSELGTRKRRRIEDSDREEEPPLTKVSRQTQEQAAPACAFFQSPLSHYQIIYRLLLDMQYNCKDDKFRTFTINCIDGQVKLSTKGQIITYKVLNEAVISTQMCFALWNLYAYGIMLEGDDKQKTRKILSNFLQLTEGQVDLLSGSMKEELKFREQEIRGSISDFLKAFDGSEGTTPKKRKVNAVDKYSVEGEFLKTSFESDKTHTLSDEEIGVLFENMRSFVVDLDHNQALAAS